jgi:hypothetical protein
MILSSSRGALQTADLCIPRLKLSEATPAGVLDSPHPGAGPL